MGRMKEMLAEYDFDPMTVIEAKCQLCGHESTVEVETLAYLRWQNGTYLQDAFPTLSPAERETVKLGFCLPCQDALFSPPEDEPEED